MLIDLISRHRCCIKPDSTLIKASDIKILIPCKRGRSNGMVPTSSTSITLLLGDSLAVALE